MLLVGNSLISVSVYQILVTLQRELRIENSHLLKTVIPPKNEQQDVQITCPFHKNGMENRPSCGVTTVEHKRGDRVVPAGVFYCFSCSAHGDITELISHCFAKHDGGLFGKQWLLDHFTNYEVENRNGFFKRWGNMRNKQEQKFISEEELAKYRFTHPYHKKRYLTEKLLDIYDIGYDVSFRLKPELHPLECITFPVKNEQGNVVFIARRSIKGKIFHYPKQVDKPIYGLWEAKYLFPDSKELYICESILNALILVKWGKPAVALLGTGTHNQIEKLKHLDYRKYILCLDPDEAGEKGIQKLYNALSIYKFIKTIKMPEGSDLNDLGYCNTYEEFLEEVKKKKENNYESHIN